VDLVHNQGQNLSRLHQFKRCCQYPIDPKNVVIRTQADASRPIQLQNGGATINGQELLELHEV
jgi:hypothetical protein